jgi:hypothetical protein
MPKSRKSPGRRGARTGVETNNVPNGDSIEQWIDSTKSPERRNEAREEEEQQSHEPETPPPKKTAKKKTKTPKENVSMKLSGADEDDGSKDQGDDRRFSSGSSEARDYARKVIRSSRKSDLTSPSELSRVSTAAPSPAPDEDITEDNNENSNNFPADDRHESDIEVENPMLTQEEENEPEVAREEDVAKQAAIKNSAETTEVASPDDDFNMGGNDYESDGADPMLPPTGDDFSDDEDRVPPTDEEAAKKTEEQIDGLEESDNENDANDDFDDEDNEGPGYNMVHDPETPEAVRAARAKREKENLEQRKGRKKKRRSDSDTDATQESSKATPKPKKGKRQKNTKRSVVFSPQGIPIANREYDRIPIGAFIESSPEDGGPRRSKRAKIKPLEFWRGEKMEFGAHDEEGELAEAFGNMPVVKEIQKANPTPYKKKKVPAAAGGKKKKKSNDKGGVDEREEFDSRKLRRKYKYIDGEEAYLWDDSNEDAGDQSKDVIDGCLGHYFTSLNSCVFVLLVLHRGCFLCLQNGRKRSSATPAEKEIRGQGYWESCASLQYALPRRR